MRYLYLCNIYKCALTHTHALSDVTQAHVCTYRQMSTHKRHIHMCSHDLPTSPRPSFPFTLPPLAIYLPALLPLSLSPRSSLLPFPFSLFIRPSNLQSILYFPFSSRRLRGRKELQKKRKKEKLRRKEREKEKGREKGTEQPLKCSFLLLLLLRSHLFQLPNQYHVVVNDQNV